ncbi:MAG TPA: hypothetical protein VMS32_04995, partial [Verrucomicrobiae bacterium]|nr:hypothetical protein [Verrucomicrobiae bacterium]
PAPTDTALPSGLSTPASAAIDRLAERCFTDLQAGKIDRTQLTGAANLALPPAAVKNISKQLRPLRAPSSFVLKYTGRSGDVAEYVYRVTFDDGRAVMFGFSFDIAQGKVAGLHFGPTS